MKYLKIVFLSALLVMALAVGCSSEQPAEPQAEPSAAAPADAAAAAPADEAAPEAAE